MFNGLKVFGKPKFEMLLPLLVEESFTKFWKNFKKCSLIYIKYNIWLNRNQVQIRSLSTTQNTKFWDTNIRFCRLYPRSSGSITLIDSICFLNITKKQRTSSESFAYIGIKRLFSVKCWTIQRNDNTLWKGIETKVNSEGSKEADDDDATRNASSGSAERYITHT